MRKLRAFMVNPVSGAGYVDGMNLYRAYFVPNSIDPTGLATWETTEGSVNTIEPNNSHHILATTEGALEYKVKCKCVSKKWVLDSIVVKFHIQVDYYTNTLLYEPGELEAAEKAEQDHVKDFKDWAAGDGKKEADAVEAQFQSRQLEDQSYCERYIKTTLEGSVGLSYREALRKTKEKWDDSGLHTYPGP